MKGILFGFTMILLLLTSIFHIVSDINWINTAEASATSEYSRVVVEPGDSLWSLADQHNEKHQMGIQEMMDLLQEENDLEDPYLYPGQVIKIPEPSK